MRRKLSIVLVLASVMIVLTACGKFTCDFCGEEKSGKNYETEILGKELVMCQDCYEDTQEMFGGN